MRSTLGATRAVIGYDGFQFGFCDRVSLALLVNLWKILS